MIVTSWSLTIMRMLVARDYLVVLSMFTAVLGDYQGYSNYVYPETYNYPDNTSLASYNHYYHNQPTQRSRRLLDQGLLNVEGSKFRFRFVSRLSDHLNDFRYMLVTYMYRIEHIIIYDDIWYSCRYYKSKLGFQDKIFS